MNEIKLSISNEADRLSVATVLLKNGYTVRQEKSGGGQKGALVIIKEDNNV